MYGKEEKLHILVENYINIQKNVYCAYKKF